MQLPGDGQKREHLFLSLTRLNFWLATVRPNAIPDKDRRARVVEYQTDCADALFERFFGKAHPPAPAPLPPLTRRPWHELPLEERRLELSTAAHVARFGNHPLGLHYLVQVMGDVYFPRTLMPAGYQHALALETAITVRFSGGTH